MCKRTFCLEATNLVISKNKMCRLFKKMICTDCSFFSSRILVGFEFGICHLYGVLFCMAYLLHQTLVKVNFRNTLNSSLVKSRGSDITQTLYWLFPSSRYHCLQCQLNCVATLSQEEYDQGSTCCPMELERWLKELLS